MGEAAAPVRILHVVGLMKRAGTETWLMNVLRGIDRDSYHMDFLTHGDGAYDDEIRSMGSEVIRCSRPLNPTAYIKQLTSVLRERGPYDIVHSHIHFRSGLVLRVAHAEGVRMRIAHSHNDTSSVQSRSSLARRVYPLLARRWIHRHATDGFAVSRMAARDLFGRNWERDRRWRVMPIGIDVESFDVRCDSAEVRAELGIPANAFVIGHIGRFEEQKNHSLLVEIIACAARRDPNVWALLVGEGPLREQVERKARRLGVDNRIVFAGARADVPRLMLGAMDVFVFPSLFEGLGLALIEAQAAGIPSIVSDKVPPESRIVEPLVEVVSVLDPAEVWAEAISEKNGAAQVLDRGATWAAVANSPYNNKTAIRDLVEMYSASRSSDTVEATLAAGRRKR